VASLLRRPTWQADALCREYPNVDFFPERGGDQRPAKRICAACSVRQECSAWADTQGADLVGVWGGRGQSERAAGSDYVAVARGFDYEPGGYDDPRHAEAAEMRATGRSLQAIGDYFGHDRSTILRWLRPGRGAVVLIDES
jgi:hypothetical protein